MISAKEVREIAAKSRDEQFKRDLKTIEDLIRTSAEVGQNYVVYDGRIDDEIRKILEAAGYKVIKYPRVTNDIYSLGYKISW